MRWRQGVPYDAVGFRPVLEPLSPNVLLNGLTVGSNIKVYGPMGMSTLGRLEAFDDYDLLLSNPSKILNGCCIVLRKRNAIVISRANSPASRRYGAETLYQKKRKDRILAGWGSPLACFFNVAANIESAFFAYDDE